MYLIKRLNKSGGIRKYDVCLRIHDGRQMKFPGDRNLHRAEELGRKIEMLVRAKLYGELPPVGLTPWIDNMPRKLAKRLTTLGLIDRRRVEQNQPVSVHIDSFKEALSSRRSNTLRYATQTAGRLRTVCKLMGADTIKDITEDQLNRALSKMAVSAGVRKGGPLSAKTRREYIFAVKLLLGWAVDNGLASNNPLARMRAPGARENPVLKRRHFTLDEFRKLMRHLDTFQRYAEQTSKWTSFDRKLIYWTAVKTGLRFSELKSLRRTNLQLDVKPATVMIEAGFAKNRTEWKIPIPSDLAAALRDYTARLHPAAPVFPIPQHPTAIKFYFRDLVGAGISRKTGAETLDFHSLRHTAITWWLAVDRLSLKEVQFLARLKTLALVERYSQYYRPDQFPHLDASPSLISKLSNRKNAG